MNDDSAFIDSELQRIFSIRKSPKFVIAQWPQEEVKDSTIFHSLADHVVKLQSQALIVDFAEQEYINSAQVSWLLLIRRKLDENSCRMFLCGISKSVEDVISVMQLDGLFEIRQSVEEAFEEF